VDEPLKFNNVLLATRQNTQRRHYANKHSFQILTDQNEIKQISEVAVSPWKLLQYCKLPDKNLRDILRNI
jgi:hypothetical protein